jgi:hypothetical protein
MGKATDDKENESRGFRDVALTLTSSRSRRSVKNTYVRFLGFWVLLRPGGPYFDRRDLAMIGPMLRHAGRHNGRRGGRFRLLPGIKPAVAAKSRTG